MSNGAAFVGSGYVGHVRLRHRPLLDRPDRLAGLAIQDEEERLFGWLCQRLDRTAIHDQVVQEFTELY
jgi:hypothetical protein